MSENQSLMNKPKKIWNDALKMVRGEDPNQLMEHFTAEMTLVAEGLCEDQNKLRGEVDRMMNEEDRRLQQVNSRVEEIETLMAERERESDQLVTELRNRLSALEKQNTRLTREQEQREKKEKKSRNLVRDITILIAVAAIAVIVVSLVLKYA